MLTPFGTALRKLRLDKGLRLLDLAQALNQSSAFISAVETGRKNIPLGYVEAISDVLRLSTDETKTLKTAADQTMKEVKVDRLSGDHRELVAQFARTVDELPSDFLDILRKQIYRSYVGERPFNRRRRGLMVTATSTKDLRRFSEQVRAVFVGPSQIEFPIMDVLEFRLQKLLPDYFLRIGDAGTMGGDEGRVHAGESWIMLRQDVYEGAWNGQGRHRFTAAHELGHYLLHRNAGMARMREDHQPIYRDAEWQADEFAGSLLMSPRHRTSFVNADDAARKCGMSPEAARVMLLKHSKEAAM